MRNLPLLIIGAVIAAGALIAVYVFVPKPAPSDTRNVTANVNAAKTATADVFLVAVGDDGKAGAKIGCGDSLVPVKDIATVPDDGGLSADMVAAALNKLLSMKDQFYGQSGLYNALYQSTLRVDTILIGEETVTVAVSGQLQLGGTCDTPRVKEQILATIMQFPGATNAAVTLNGKTLDEALSLR